ncbi:MAG: hypothetical protein RXP86_10250 [Acidilobus sp.]
MNRIGRLALVAGILAMALAVPMAAANVIYLYHATVNMPSTLPVYFKPGPDASEVNLQLANTTAQTPSTTKNGTLVTLTVPVTNATEIYVYHALELVVNSPPSPLATPLTLYVNYCDYSGSTTFNNITLVVYSTGSTPSFTSGEEIELTPSSTSCSASYTVSLSPGTYYVDFAIFPSQAAPVGSTATLSILFGFSYGSSAPNTYGSIP